VLNICFKRCEGSVDM